MVQALPKSTGLLLQLPADLALTVTVEQFEQLAAANRELHLERTAEGVLIVNPPTGWETGKRNFNLLVDIGVWMRTKNIGGEAFDSSTAFTLPNGAHRSPDASWISQDRWDALSDTQKQETFAPVCPNFVVELRSKTDNLKPIQEKMQEYIDNGAELGWLLDPKNKKVEIYRPGKAVEVLDRPSSLSGEPVLPGFTLNVGTIW